MIAVFADALFAVAALAGLSIIAASIRSHLSGFRDLAAEIGLHRPALREVRYTLTRIDVTPAAAQVLRPDFTRRPDLRRQRDRGLRAAA